MWTSPLNELDVALSSPGEQFEQLYGFTKPTLQQAIILTCRSGRRSGLALEVFRKAGYAINVRNYQGSWNEWSAREAAAAQAALKSAGSD